MCHLFTYLKLSLFIYTEVSWLPWCLVTTLQHKLLKNISDFYSLLFFFFFFNLWFSYFLEKQNATHSSSKPRLVERDLYFENAGRGPYYTNNWLLPSTGLVFIYSGEEPHRTGKWRAEVSGREAKVSHWFQGRKDISKGSGVAFPHQQGQMYLALLTSTWVSALEKV